MRKWIAAVVGFGTMCPWRLLDTINLRSNDVVAVLLACAAAAAFLSSSRRDRPMHIAYLAIALMTVGWIGADRTFGAYMPQDMAATMLMVRWIVAIVAAFYLAILCEHTTFRKYLIAGFIVGCLATTALAIFDFTTYQLTGQPAFLPEETDITYVNGDYRAIGILAHPNGEAIGSLFIVPFLIGMAEEFGMRRLAFVLAPAATCVVFYITQTRGAAIASAVLLLVWGLKRRFALVITGLAGAAVLGGVLLVANPASMMLSADGRNPLTEVVNRFNDASALDDNAADRVETTVASMQLAWSHPFGMGSTYETSLDEVTGFTATHNAWLQLALMGGLPLMAIVACIVGGAAIKTVFLPRYQTHEWVALYIVFVSMFEAAYYIPFFSMMVLWVVARALMPKPTQGAPAYLLRKNNGDTTLARS